MENTNQGVEVRPVKEHEEKLVELCIARSFSKDPTNPTIPDFIKIKLMDPNFFWGVFVDGKPVAGLKLIPFEIQIEHTILHVLGLTGVGTDPNHRHKGYASKLLQGVHQFLKKKGFDGTILHSAADILYVKNGYEFAFCEWEHQINLEPFLNECNLILKNSQFSEYHAEFYIRSDITQSITDQLFSIRNSSILFKNRPFRVNRTSNYMFEQCLRLLERPNMVMEILFNSNIPIAYLFAEIKEERIDIIENYSIYDEKECYILLWKNLIDQFENLPKNLIIKTYFHDEIIKSIVKQFQGKTYRLAMVGNMAHLFDPASIIKKLKPTFEHRMKNKIPKTEFHSFILIVRNQQIIFEINDSQLNLIDAQPIPTKNQEYESLPKFEIPEDEFAGLIFGYLELEDLDIIHGTNFSELEPTLRILFPPLEPIWDYWHKY
jgi:predicted acetyltransferase